MPSGYRSLITDHCQGHEQGLRPALQAGRARSVTAVFHHSRVVQRQDARLLTAQCGFESYLGSQYPSIAQSEQSTRLRAGRSQVRVLLDGPTLQGVAQSGSAPGLEPGGRRFESYRPDQLRHRWIRRPAVFRSGPRRRPNMGDMSCTATTISTSSRPFEASRKRRRGFHQGVPCPRSSADRAPGFYPGSARVQILPRAPVGELAERQGIAVLTRRDRKVGQVRLLHSPPDHAGIAQRQSRGLPNRRSRVRSPLPAPLSSRLRLAEQDPGPSNRSTRVRIPQAAPIQTKCTKQ